MDKEILKKVTDEFCNMSREEFLELLKEHKDGDISKVLKEFLLFANGVVYPHMLDKIEALFQESSVDDYYYGIAKEKLSPCKDEMLSCLLMEEVVHFSGKRLIVYVSDAFHAEVTDKNIEKLFTYYKKNSHKGVLRWAKEEYDYGERSVKAGSFQYG